MTLSFVQLDRSVCFASTEENYIVTASSCCVYAEPNLSSKKIEHFKNKDVVNLEMIDGEPTIESSDNFNFYKLKDGIVVADETYSYILCELVTKESPQIMSIPNFNAKTNKKCEVYDFQETGDGLKYVANEISLKKGEQIFLYQGYNSKKPFTAVSFLQDNKVYYAYLKTEDISPNGINPIILTCIFLTIAVLGIIFAWVFISKRKIKLKSKKVKSEYNLKKQ